MFGDEIHDLVYEAYSGLASPMGAGARFYSEEELAVLPEDARHWVLGVGSPVAHAGLTPGADVIDLGCGAGVDVMLAARQVAPTGTATGIDFLSEMVERGQRFAQAGGFDNARFVLGEIEDLPVPDESADVVISNGSINLAARKSRVLAEAHRVLRPGGRVCITDLTLAEEELPPQILTHPSAWAG